MASHNAKTCRHCSCQRKSCRRRKGDPRRRVKCFIPHAQFLLAPFAGAIYQQRNRKRFDRKDPFLVLTGDNDDVDGQVPHKVAINSEDLRVMCDLIDQMQQQLNHGLQNLQELCAMVNEVAAQRECEGVR